jgi:hypothetical protein
MFFSCDASGTCGIGPGLEPHSEVDDVFHQWDVMGQMTQQVETPLPAALPLFATGLGGLGLLGWRRKRKAQAV